MFSFCGFEAIKNFLLCRSQDPYIYKPNTDDFIDSSSYEEIESGEAFNRKKVKSRKKLKKVLKTAGVNDETLESVSSTEMKKKFSKKDKNKNKKSSKSKSKEKKKKESLYSDIDSNSDVKIYSNIYSQNLNLYIQI